MTEQEIIRDLVVQLSDIYFTAKNVHWFSRTYGNHLLFDRIAEGLLDHIDALVEVALMDAETFLPMPIATTNTATTAAEQIIHLHKLLTELLTSLNSIQSIFSEAVKNELNGLAQDVQVKINLLSMVE